MAEGEGFDRLSAGPELHCREHSSRRKIPLRHATGMSHLESRVQILTQSIQEMSLTFARLIS